MKAAIEKSLESWIWDAACSIRGAQEAPKFKDFILPLIFTKRLCDVFDDELNRIAEGIGSRAKAFRLVEKDHKLVRFYLPLKPDNPDDAVWSVIRKLTGKIGETLTTHLHAIAKANPALEGIIDRMDFNATTHGQRDIDDDRLSNLIERVSEKRLGLNDVEADVIGRSYEYLIRKFAENSGQSAGEFFTPPEVARIMALVMNPEPGMSVYDPCCGSAGLLIECEHVLNEKVAVRSDGKCAPLRMHGQEYVATTWAMANMNMIIHDMEGTIEIGDTFKNPRFRAGNRLQTFDRVVSNPMWNQEWFTSQDYENDEFGRFPAGAGYPGSKADWGWIQHITASLSEAGKAAIVMGTGSASRGSGDNIDSQERAVRRYFVDNDLIEAVILLPFNLFYNTDAPGVVYIINKRKPAQRRERILFINASTGFVRGRPKNRMTDEWVSRVAKIYEEYAELDGVSRVVHRADVALRDYHLRPSRYVFTVATPKVVKLRQARASFHSAVETVSSTAARMDTSKIGRRQGSKALVKSEFGLVSIDSNLRVLSEFIEEVDDRAGNSESQVLSVSKLHGIILQSDKFGHTSVASKDRANYKVVAPGEFAFDPMLLWDGSIGVNRYPFAGVVSPAYTVFRVLDNSIDSDYLEFVLRTPVMIPLYISISDGTNMRRRKARFSDFAALRIPMLPQTQQSVIGDSVRLQSHVRTLSSANHQLANSLLISSLFGLE